MAFYLCKLINWYNIPPQRIFIKIKGRGKSEIEILILLEPDSVLRLDMSKEKKLFLILNFLKLIIL